ncbi:hypothetical protein D3C85_1921280 [compost metagenome]
MSTVLPSWMTVKVTGKRGSSQKTIFPFRNGGSHRLRVSEASRAVSISTSRLPSDATTTVLAEEKASGRMT